MKTCSTSLIIREIKIKTTMRHHLKPVRKAVIKKSTNNEECWRGCGEKRILLYCCLEKEMAPHSSTCLENPMDSGAWWAAVHGVARVGHD